MKGHAMQKGKLTAVLVIMSLLIAAFGTSAWANLDPKFNPSVSIKKSTGTIDIDGRLDDPGWKTKAWVAGFVERSPGENVQPMADTKVNITYDEDNLYIAFLCKDNPHDIRATMCQRDRFSGDDAVAVLLDTYGDANWAYEFYVNPYGIQKDMLWTSIAGEDYGYDLIWESAAKITDSGYQVEIAVPFASIRFPNSDVQNWKIDFYRNHPRESFHQYSWAAYDRNEQCWPCQWGTMDGISDVSPGQGMEILPSLVANQAGQVEYDKAGLPFENSKIDGELSLGGKYSLNSDITLEATYNPDFSQVETDAAQIDVNSTIALFYPERRPFFQEGTDIFRTLFNSFYTRTVNDPQFASKLTGRFDGFRFGLLSAVDENSQYIIPFDEFSSQPLNVGKSYVNVLRGIKSIGDFSHVGFAANDRRFDAGGFNTILGVDGNIRLTRNYSIDGQYLVTFNEEIDDTTLSIGEYRNYNLYTFNKDRNTAAFDGEKFTGYAFITRLKRNSRHYNFMLDYNQVDHTYRTQIGYDPWVNYRNGSMWNGYNFYPENSIFNRITTSLWVDGRWQFNGDLKWYHINASLEGQLNLAQIYYNLSYSRSEEVWFGQNFGNLWNANFNLNIRPINQLGLYGGIDWGIVPAFNQMIKGNELRLSASVNLKPIDRLIIEPDYNLAISNDVETNERLYINYVSRNRIQLQVTRALSLRLILQYAYRETWYKYDDFETGETVRYDQTTQHFDLFPLITYKLNPFTIFYIGATGSFADWKQTGYDYYFDQGQFPGNADLERDWNMDNRQFFMKLQYLFQT